MMDNSNGSLPCLYLFLRQSDYSLSSLYLLYQNLFTTILSQTITIALF